MASSTFKKKRKTDERIRYEDYVALFWGENSALASYARVQNALLAISQYAENREGNKYTLRTDILEYFHDHYLNKYVRDKIKGDKATRVYNADEKDFNDALSHLQYACDPENKKSCYAKCSRLVLDLIKREHALGLVPTVNIEQENINNFLWTFIFKRTKKDKKWMPFFRQYRRTVGRLFWLKKNRDKSLLAICQMAWKALLPKFGTNSRN